ncbi:MAG: hypothetical protein D3X82_16920 [Candidatus Leucobacter sulfamidivorax]|nr:hypothetical protein [Candidatus Leucobacter sulfamidivorax]
MVARIPEAQAFGRMRADRERTDRRVTDLERTDGSQYARTLEKIKALVAGLDATVQSYISLYSYTKAQIDAHTWAAGSIYGVLAPGQGGTGTANVYDNPLVGGSALAVYVTSDGVLNKGASSARWKQDITAWDGDPAVLLELAVRRFRWRVEAAAAGEQQVDLDRYADDGGPEGPEPGPAPWDFGLIAEEVQELGADWLVRLGEDGLPEGVHYHRLPIALLALVQQQHQIITRQGKALAAFEARLAALEERSTR